MGAPALPPELAPFAAAFQANADLAHAPEHPRHPRVGERKVPGKCRVIGCTADLRRQTPSNVKNRLCQAHWSAPVLVFRGVDNRFCSKCTRLRPLSDFDGDKRTCRKCLESHTARRRARQIGGSGGAFRARADRGADRSTSTSEERSPHAHDGSPYFEGASPALGPAPQPYMADVLAAAMAEAAKTAVMTNAWTAFDGAGGSRVAAPHHAPLPAAPALGGPQPASLRRLAAAIKVEKLNMELAQARQELELAQLEEALGALQGGAAGASTIPTQLLETIQRLIKRPDS